MNFVKASTVLASLILLCSSTGISNAATEAKKDRVQDEVPVKAPLPNWTVTCNNQNTDAVLRCQVDQTLYVTTTRQRIISVTLTRNRENEKFVNVVVGLPHGIKFSSGLKFWVDEGKKRSVDISYADAQGSYAAFPIDQAMVNEFKSGKLLRFLVSSLSGAQTIFEMKLDGFPASFKYVESFRK